MRSKIKARIIQLGGEINPRTLNKYIMDNQLYDKIKYEYSWDIISRITDGAVAYMRPLENVDDRMLIESLKIKRPSILRLINQQSGNKHSVVTRGMTSYVGFIINDPGKIGNYSMGLYNNSYFAIRPFQEWDGSPPPSYLTFKGYKQ
jgi:hypothetical protein